MIFWNRVEIYKGNSKKEFSSLRNSLAAAGIQYDYRLISLKHPVRHYIPVQQTEHDITYCLYIHQKDYFHAMHLTSCRNA